MPNQDAKLPIDRQVVTDLAGQTLRYQAAEAVAVRIADKLGRREDISEEVAELAELMKQADAAAAHAMQVRDAWVRAGRPTSAELDSALQKHTEVLQNLIALVQRAEAEATAARDALRPRLDDAARDRKAIAVYGQAAKL